MRYYYSKLSNGEQAGKGLALHAVDDRAEGVYTYSQELKTWNLDRRAVSDLHFPELDRSGDMFTEISRQVVYSLLPKAPRMDRRDDAMRQISNSQRAQMRRSGQVLTSAEVGLLTKPLQQRPTTAPMLRELLETRSQHKRWTALFLYETDGPARRTAMSSLRNNARINISAKGQSLIVQHRKRRFSIDGELQRYTAVEVKYVPHSIQGSDDAETHDG